MDSLPVSQTAEVVADELLTKGLHTNTSSFPIHIQEPMETHLSQQPQHEVLQLRISAWIFQVRSAHPMEYTAFLLLFSLCYFLLFPSHQATAAKLRSGLPCAKDMMKERILTFRKSQELLSQALQRLGLYLNFQLQHFCCWWCQTLQENLIIG